MNLLAKIPFQIFFAFIVFGGAIVGESESLQPVGSAPKIEVFVTSWCPYCSRLEDFLKAKKIKYVRYDIEKDPNAKARYERLGGGGVPITQIGSTVVRGLDEQAILSAVEEHKEENRGSRLPSV